MTDKITLVFWRVNRPLLAALIGLALVKAVSQPEKIPEYRSASTVVVKISDH